MSWRRSAIKEVNDWDLEYTLLWELISEFVGILFSELGDIFVSEPALELDDIVVEVFDDTFVLALVWHAQDYFQHNFQIWKYLYCKMGHFEEKKAQNIVL